MNCIHGYKQKNPTSLLGFVPGAGLEPVCRQAGPHFGGYTPTSIGKPTLRRTGPHEQMLTENFKTPFLHHSLNISHVLLLPL